MKLRWIGLLVLAALTVGAAAQVNRIRDASEMLLPTGRSIQPEGTVAEVYGRPVDGVLSLDGRLMLSKDRSNLRVIDTETWEIVASLPHPGGSSITGMTETQGITSVIVTSPHLPASNTVTRDSVLVEMRNIVSRGPAARCRAVAPGAGRGMRTGCQDNPSYTTTPALVANHKRPIPSSATL